MSLILDALRKIELERKAKRHGGIDLRPEVLSYRGTPQKTPQRSRILLIGGAVLLLLGIAAVIFLRSAKTDPMTKAAPPPPVRAAAPAPLPLPPAPSQPLQSLPATIKADSNRPETAPRPLLPGQDTAPGGEGADNITVSGIAWQEERELRRAVVNGSLVAEGAEILGARVLEIKENRVRFSRGGNIFEVQYPAAAGR